MNKEETDLIIAEQNKSTEEILKAVAKVKADYHELCKLKDMRIAELEHQLTHRNCLDCSNHSSKLRMRTLELEKENAELKERNRGLDAMLTGESLVANGLEEQLTKAKELIEELNEGLDKLYLSGLSNKQIAFIEQLQDKAEQFISEVEE